MHDRRIDGVPQTFGNAGGLFMSAMTWYDHETRSIWSQPWGRAIEGPRRGITLFLLPSQLTTWGAWRREHPESLVMVTDFERYGGSRTRFREGFVIGVILEDAAKAYPFSLARERRVINDWVGDHPVLVWASEDNFHAYLRRVGDMVLTFRAEGDDVVDGETGSRWDVARGLAVSGPLRGQGLLALPVTSAFDWAWLDFYPESEIYQP